MADHVIGTGGVLSFNSEEFIIVLLQNSAFKNISISSFIQKMIIASFMSHAVWGALVET